MIDSSVRLGWYESMSLCPYTWFRDAFLSTPDSAAKKGELAQHLHVRVIKAGVETVRVALPAKSARWLIEIIPNDVVDKIRSEKIPLDDILEDLKSREKLLAQPIFQLKEESRQVDVWLE